MAAAQIEKGSPSSTTSWVGYEVVLTRTFAAPRSLVFKAWIDPEHLAQWWGPHGFTNPVRELDPRPGGRWRIVMRGPDAADHPAKGVYREVVAPETYGAIEGGRQTFHRLAEYLEELSS